MTTRLPPRHSASLAAPPVEPRSLSELTQRWRSRHGLIVEECVCGGEIEAASGSDQDVLVAVQRHQLEPRHIAYDREHGIPWSEAQRRAAILDRVEAR